MPESLVDVGHADQYHRDVRAVVFGAEQFECGGGEAFGFIDDEQLDRVRSLPEIERDGVEGA